MYLNLKLIYFIVWQKMRQTRWESKQCSVMGGIRGGKLQTKWAPEKGKPEGGVINYSGDQALQSFSGAL